MQKEPIDLAKIRARLAGATGKQFWRSLEELAETSEFKEFLHREFPKGAAELNDSISRRSFLKLMAASFALAGLTGCAQVANEKIVPYVQQPDPRITPGRPLYFATAMPMPMGGYGLGLIAESNMGRPTKVEGNPQHPASLGATDVFAQASVLTLYDPERVQAVTNLGQISTWENFLGALSGRLATLNANGGAGLRLLTGAITSPTLGAQLQALLTQLPQARWHQYDPAGLDNLRAGAQLAFGQPLNTVYRFDQAARILSLDANFLYEFPGSVRYARHFMDRRRVSGGQREMNRLYVVESTPTITGAMADHRLPARADRIADFARALAQQAGVAGAPPPITPLSQAEAAWVAAAARDLQASRSAGIVIAGLEQPPLVHALAHAINAALGNAGATVIYTEPVEINPVDQIASLRELVADIGAGQVDTLITIDSNPVFTAPADLNFADALRRVPFSAHMSLYYDETSALSQWQVPQTHYLEMWGDVRAFDGTASIIQPLVQPLYNGHSPYELLAALGGNSDQSGYDIVRDYWQGQPQAGANFDQFWLKTLNDGVVEGSAFAPAQPAAGSDFGPAPPAPAEGLELVFRPDPSVWDGRFANNGWLQELPRPMTTLTWDNAAMISAATAERLGLTTDDVAELSLGGRTLRAAIWVAPGHADESVTLHLGYGRGAGGRVGQGVGFNAYALRSADTPWISSGLALTRTGERYELANTQAHFSMEGRELVRAATLEDFLREPEFAKHEFDQALPSYQTKHPESAAAQPEGGAEEQHGGEGVPSLYPEYEYNGYAWGMAIDTNACIGCNACTIACQAENNIPIIGKEGVLRSREMHWIKVDRYYEGSMDNPDMYFQPRPCMHCENAPCEVVCPVVATVHDNEGLNTMIYNRCVGTRYCSNNCPYKVRRFNYFDYRQDIPVINLVRNPEVTVRERGVMEKCTYCIQRIEEVRIEAKKAGRPIADQEVQTACQQVCPTGAIVFGNINDPNSQVSKLKATPLNYGLLSDLGTQPRTTYLARLRNPNPELG